MRIIPFSVPVRGYSTIANRGALIAIRRALIARGLLRTGVAGISF